MGLQKSVKPGRIGDQQGAYRDAPRSPGTAGQTTRARRLGAPHSDRGSGSSGRAGVRDAARSTSADCAFCPEADKADVWPTTPLSPSSVGRNPPISDFRAGDQGNERKATGGSKGLPKGFLTFGHRHGPKGALAAHKTPVFGDFQATCSFAANPGSPAIFQTSSDSARGSAMPER